MIIELSYVLSFPLGALPDIRGPIDGGTLVTVLGGTGYLDTGLDDDFPGAVLDPGKWVSAVAGSGTVSQNDGLFLRTGTAVSSQASITSVSSLRSVADFQVDFNVAPSTDTSPVALVRYLDAEFYISPTQYLRVSRVYDPAAPVASRNAFLVSCVIAGVEVDSVLVASDALSGTLRLVRVRSKVSVWVGENPIYEGDAFDALSDAVVVFRVANPSATYPFDFTTELTGFVIPTLVLFGDSPGAVQSVSDNALSVKSPSVRTPRTVGISIWTAGGLLVDTPDVFTYVIVSEFVTLADSGGTLIAGLLNDTTLRNRTDGHVGLLS